MKESVKEKIAKAGREREKRKKLAEWFKKEGKKEKK